jgi:hypothetical protein
MKAPVRIRKLEAEEYNALKKWAASRRMAAGRVKRAQIILLSNQGYIASEIAQSLDLNDWTSMKSGASLDQSFQSSGVSWIGREGPEWSPPVYSTEEVSSVLALAQTLPQ